jgi:hypothetical protein
MSGRLVVPNYRGAPVPRTLGLVLAGSAWIATFAWAGMRGADAAVWGTLVACLLVFAAGVLDDLVPGGPRGVREHLRALAEGHVTSGIVKILVAVGAAVVAIALAPARPGWVRLLGVVLVAASANVWNGLDVRPGRALKAFVPIGALFVAFGDVAVAPAVLGVAVGAVGVLWHDLTERAMLGDGGANLLGFSAGLALYLLLPGWGVGLTAFLAVGLNLLAETVTLTRAIAMVPALRWIDGLGRRRDAV